VREGVLSADATSQGFDDPLCEGETEPGTGTLRAGSAREKGSKTRSRSSGAMPSPESTDTSWSWPFRRPDTRTAPSFGVWRTAFINRFWSTRVMRGEQVTDAPHREQVDRLGWVSLDLLAQSSHVHRDRRAVPVPREVPDVLEEL
jgi:hypothetical protein